MALSSQDSCTWSRRQSLSVGQQLRENDIVIEEIQWLGSATEHSSRLLDLLETRQDDILDALNMRGPHGGIESTNHLFFWLVETKQLKGFLLNLRTPVLARAPGDPKYGAFQYSWANTHDGWIYVENLTDLRAKAFSWQEAVRKNDKL